MIDYTQLLYKEKDVATKCRRLHDQSVTDGVSLLVKSQNLSTAF